MTEAGQRTDLVEPRSYDQGWDDAFEDIWEANVCSSCGENHDASESAMCEDGEVVSFREWTTIVTARVDRLEKALRRAAHVAEHLHQMIDRDTWRAHGAEWQGHYEGDAHAEGIAYEIESWKVIAGE